MYDALVMGPMATYKYVASGGFTFVFDFGYQWGLVRAEAQEGNQSESASADLNTVLLNLNLGWSF